MKQAVSRRALSLLLALALTLSLLSGLTITVYADDILLGTPTGYTQASDVIYDTSGTYVKNWGARGESCTFLTTFAQEYYTDNYSYAVLSGKAGITDLSDYESSPLYTALRTMLQSRQTSAPSYSGTTGMYRYSDCVNSNSNNISSFYSGRKLNGAWDSGATWNREHVWPQSKMIDEDHSGSFYSDIMMLRPTSITENSGRGNKAYGEQGLTGYYYPNSEIGSANIDLRGDCARVILYCYVRWNSQVNMWGTGGVIQSKEVLLQWMEADPVDTWEMGRNDAVQSMIGVRNCFVDYPELAFLLFNEPIPADYCSPSGGDSGAFTVSASANNAAWGSVAVNGYTVTATPGSGYYVKDYTLISGTATVTRNGNVFTLLPSSDCAIRINFAPITSVTLTFMADGELYQTVQAYAGETVMLPDAATAADGWTLTGWVESEAAETQTAPAFLAPGASLTPTESKTFFALYEKTEGGTGTGLYTRMTDVSILTPGLQVILASTANAKTAGDISSSVLTAVSTEFSANGSTLTPADGTVIFTVGGSAGAWTFAGPNGKLLGATAVKKLAWGSGTTTWTVSLSGADATITSTNSTYGWIQYNAGSPRFTTYTSDQVLPQLYYLDGVAGVTTYTTNPSGHAHVHTLSYQAAVSPTCVDDGNIAYWYCTVCAKRFSDATGENEITPSSTLIPATGEHSYGAWSPNNDGTHSRRCSVCQASVTEDCSLSAAVTPPTVTEPGYTTYTCSVCGYSYQSDYVTPIGVDYTVSFSVLGDLNVILAMTINSAAGAELPAAEGPEGWTFLGWVTEDFDHAAARPAEIFSEVYYPTGDTTLKALFRYGTDSGETVVRYELVTDVQALSAGDQIVITAKGDVNKSLSTIQNNNNRASAGGEKSADRTVFEPADGTAVLTLGTGTSQGTFSLYDPANNGYLYAASSSANYLRTKSTLDANGSWIISITNNEATLTAQGDNTRNVLQYNATNDIFSCYAGTMQAVYLYQRVEEETGTTYYTTLPDEPQDYPLGMVNTLSLESDTSLNYYIKQADLEEWLSLYGLGLSDARFVVERDMPGEDAPEITTFTNPSVSIKGGVSYYVYSFPNIAAKQLNNEMRAHMEITADGETVRTAELDYNPISYCYQVGMGTGNNELLRRACADLILYAAAAQTNFNYNLGSMPNSAQAGWNETMQSLARTEDYPAENNSDKGVSGSVINITSVTLALEGRVEMNLRMTPEDLNGVALGSLKLHYEYTDLQDVPVSGDIPFDQWKKSGEQYVAAFAKQSAGEIFQQATFTVVAEENGAQTALSNAYTVSVSDYAAFVISLAGSNETAGRLAPLMHKLLNYGASARDYLNR